ncbi:cell-envelope stress modulator CpxP [Pantoea sp. MBD-2R]|uniref:cell-envelope stress modulator CpxP n=1 Tax=unclassified Pantoea TaxID=2630326 RepID=UPI0011BD4CED|nr:cell-envelope stress modulator CpxP [Pantoea sp. CCBC3-3-1]
MRKVTAVVVVPALILSFSAAWAAEVTTNDEMHQDGAALRSMTQIPQSHMFDGINLTEQQRQQMRDLMQQARHERSSISINDLEQLHEMIIADKFNETDYKARLDRIAKEEVTRQVEMARVRNQMYHLLTPAQQDVLKQKHQQRMSEMRKLAQMQQAVSLQAVSSPESKQ